MDHLGLNAVGAVYITGGECVEYHHVTKSNAGSVRGEIYTGEKNAGSVQLDEDST